MRGTRLVLPPEVEKTLNAIRKAHKHGISVNLIRGNYYVAETTTKYVKETGRTKSFYLYLGKIERDGKFVPARHRKPETSIGSVEGLVKNKIGKDPLEQLIHPGAAELKILEAVSTDARMPIREIAKRAGVTPQVAKYKLRKLEKQYGIRYTIEMASRPLGFFRYAIFIKFLRDMPNIKDVKELLEKEPTIQLAAVMKGDYDLFIYLFAENTQTLEDKIYALRSDRVFAPFNAYWYASYITDAYGYIPLREQFFDLLKDKIWVKSRERLRKTPEQILQRDYFVLKELNENGKADFAELDRKLGYASGASDYTYHKLLEQKIIRRVTIVMQSLPIKYLLLALGRQVNMQLFNIRRKEELIYIIEETGLPTNRFVLSADIGAPYGMMSVAPLFDENVTDFENDYRNTFRGTEIQTFVLTDVFLGSFGFRKISRVYTPQYKIITEELKG